MALNSNQNIQFIRSGNFIILLVLGLFALILPFLIAKGGIAVGILIIVAIIAIPVTTLLLTNLKFGFFSILILSFFIYFIIKMTKGLVPILTLEIMMFMIFTGLILKQIRSRSSGDFNTQYLRHPITVAVIIWTVYAHLQLLNPNSSSIVGKIIAIRFSWYNLLGFIIALKVFDSIQQIKLFFKIVLGMCLLAALYGLSQKYIGLTPFDHEMLYSSEINIQLGIIWGQIRSWSFMNDPANFGLLMAFSSQLCFVLMLGPYALSRKITLGIMGVIMLLAMVTSGTRTAFVMVPVGFAIFGLLTVNNVKTIFFSLLAGLIFMIIYFGPFYSAPVQRIRSAFQGNEDASMNVRSENKKRIQPYIWTHPIGGGPSTSGEEGKKLAPGHVLAGFPPDSGYLKIALEFGFIGLLIILWQYFIASSKVVTQYFNTRNREIQTFYVVILSTFIALCFANLTQLSSAMKPFDFFIFCYFAIIIKLKEFDQVSKEQEATAP